MARYDGTLVSPSPLVNVTDSSRTVMIDLPPAVLRPTMPWMQCRRSAAGDTHVPGALRWRPSARDGGPRDLPSMTDLHDLDLTDVARRLRARELSSVEVTRHLLERIARLDGRLRSYATVTPDLALAQAGVAD